MARKVKKKTKGFTTHEVLNALEKRHPCNEWAFFDELRNSPGYSGRIRTADAIALNLWPSRGLELHGFEIKVSRSDWLQELKKPSKAEAIWKYCDRWWLVLGHKDIIKEGELPPTWGLMIPKGKSVIVKVAAPKLAPEPMGISFVASLIKRISSSRREPEAIRLKIDAAYRHGQDTIKSQEKWTITRLEQVKMQLQTKLRVLHDQIKDFEEASGLHLAGYQGATGREIGEQVRLIHDITWRTQQRVELTRMKAMSDEVSRILSEGLTSLEKLTGNQNDK